MDVLKPNYIIVKNRCYRSFEGQSDSKNRNTASRVSEESGALKKTASGNECDASKKVVLSGKKCDSSKKVMPSGKECNPSKKAASPCNECKEDESDVEVQELGDSRYLVFVDVPKCFRGLVIGSKGQSLNRITSATGTNVEFPFENSSDPIRIYGNSKADVLSARKRVIEIVDSARKRTDFTHFVAVYARESTIRQNFKRFRSEVLSKYGGVGGVTNEVFQDEHRLHLTFGILVLLGEKERKEAESVLYNVVQEFVKQTETKEAMKVRFQGLEYMNDDPSEVHVLYAKVEQIAGSIDLQLLANKIVKEFAKSKLMIKINTEDVKLHLTLMNSKYRNKEISGTYYGWPRSSKGTREPFDATQILVDFKDYFFGEMDVNEIEILRHTAFDERGYYKSTAKIPLKKATRKPKAPGIRMILEDDP